MKKTFIIALCCIAVAFASCKKDPVTPDPTPDNPTPSEEVDYAAYYVGSYIGNYLFTITSMNNQTGGSVPFEVENIGMEITKGETANTITATVTVDNQSQQATGTTTKEKATFTPLQFVIDETHQINFPYICNVEELILEASLGESDTLNIVGTFAGNGTYTWEGNAVPVEEISGTVTGKLVKQ